MEGPTDEDKTRYEALKRELVQVLPMKRAADKQLAQVEFQIYSLETSYLTETAAHNGGNIIQGFEGYLKNQSVSRRKYEINETDRVFSNSSLTYQKSIELLGEGEDATTAIDEHLKLPAAGLTTVVVPPATRTQELTAAQQKKNRDREYQRKKRASASRRSTGTISDEEHTSTGRRPPKRARLADDD